MQPMATLRADDLLGVPTDDDIAALSARNQARANAAIAKMGSRWCCHPANSPQKVGGSPRLRRATDWPALSVTGRSIEEHRLPFHNFPSGLPDPLRRLLDMGRPL